ncbi:(Fe-S)-binding protein [Alkalilimnicola ehrlichii MLHE-1]|uniref:Cysteine-rich domain-containing protein n=1 Tax=Alkalilimnicola ehrlichii (strain ATCC BAA-1101 / DSM 17681 / MLHE-1) TaxID=187272 RepID=Q0A6B3_ALKEH|nr:(Fe-S)-binding protein [Alkalilimnicola ehrlichii]ABI57624.1 protein of unknown function DUF224, cysteine-rich region domain protein [Alkalilimnicola ehrlichii MLHE-1]
MTTSESRRGPRVGLLVTCLVDVYRPDVGFAAVRLLEQAGCTVVVPTRQTCCGQPAHNSGDNITAAELARAVITAFEPYDYLVAPSGSCVGSVHKYPDLFPHSAEWQSRARHLADRSFELFRFLTDVLGAGDSVQARFPGRVTYHDSCSGLRQLGVKAQPRELLRRVEGLELVEMEDAEVCCGFGGTFCVKYPEISGRMVADKAKAAEATGADALLGGDLGCLLNMAGRLKAAGSAVRVYHTAEVLAGMADGPGIGDAEAD